MKNILWIGNSFTYFNDLPQTFENIAKSEGNHFLTDSVTKGGWYLHAHADPSDTYGAIVHEKLQQPWDAVVLQEQSFNAVKDREDYISSACAIADKCGKATIYLYQSWAYEPDSEKLAATGLSFDEMHNKLKSSINAAAEKMNATVVGVGDAVYECVKKHPEVSLYKPDSFHPNENLTYMAALCFYKVIFGEMPKGDHLPQGVTDADIIQNIVRDLNI